ncbi:heparinase II/III domain-containing protein [Ilyobacter polytropus]|uniref:Heparinase II/III family protein n=1 Tax=Ilyobacter polytropus (strain ATCC 51220 / DSM 2926 / LMG 16218 / CuHBu1) TaxID=572544 RepID=E3HC57_ILYPC|nr:heparinase II/III family protein [Ilyobacter polytropus]ADO83900.1 Heparinase II/III family protein [Ilyobacter polytropus DSM 2926]
MDYSNIGKLKSSMLKNRYQEMLQHMGAEVTNFSDKFNDNYNKMSEWGHMYFCEEDGAILDFNLEKPHIHICTVCGTEYKSRQLDNVWVYFYRGKAIQTALNAAVVYKATKEKKYLEYLEKIIGYYTRHYTDFAIHSKDAAVEITTTGKLGYARIMPQELNEAVIVVKIARIMEILKEDLSEEFKESVKNMFREVFQILAPQVNKVHNKPCWSVCAIGSMGFVIQDKEMIDFAFNSEFNINRQLEEGVTSGIWYEGSMYYSFFTLEGIADLLLFAKTYDYKAPIVEATVELMLKTAYDYAFDNLIFPNPNDGWPDINLKTFSFLYHLGYKIFGEEKMGALLRKIERSDLVRRDPQLAKPYYYNNEISLEELLFNNDFDMNGVVSEKSNTSNFESSNVGILKNNNVNVFIKYGHQARSHAHSDKMNLEVTLGGELISRDLSNSGYVSKLCNEWHRVTAAHNTVAVNGKSHTSISTGNILKFNETTCHVRSEDLYEGVIADVNFERKIELTEKGFNDLFEVETKEGETLDWFFHFESSVEFMSNLETSDFSLGYSEDGYQHITNVREVKTNGKTALLKFKANKVEFTVELDMNHKKLILCDTVDNPVDKKRTSIILRSNRSNDTFTAKWEIKN